VSSSADRARATTVLTKTLSSMKRSTPAQALLQRVAPALFHQEGPQFYGAAYQHNAAFARPSTTDYQTPLYGQQEQQFRQWVTHNNIPFDPNARRVDYDMRGYWLSQQHGGQGRAANGHFPDTYKTPYDTTFSGESRYAKPGTPFVWQGNTLVDTRTGQRIFG
jgi:hypothetical protein